MIQIDQEHLEYKRQASTWRVYRDLYAAASSSSCMPLTICCLARKSR